MGSIFETTVIATLVASFISSLVAYWIGVKTIRSMKHHRIEEHILKLIDYEIQYPRYVDDSYCSKWDRHSKEIDDLRYSSYCSHVFNTIEMVWNFFNGNRNKIDEYMNVRELVLLHKEFWKSDEENISSYPDKFRLFIDSYLK